MSKSQATSSYRTTEENKQSLIDLWGSVSAGTEKAVDAYVALRPRIIQDTMKKFSRSELSAMIDTLNGTMFQSQFASKPQMLAYEMEDGDKYDEIGEKWEIDVDLLVNKIKLLNPASCYFMQEEINRFWYNENEYGGPGKKLDNFLAKYLGGAE